MKSISQIKNPLIFIIDDDPFHNYVVKEKLKSNNFSNVKDFKSGQEGIEHLNEHPDIILLDYLLGDMKGSEVLKKIREKLPSTKVIMVTSERGLNTSELTLGMGAYSYVVKDKSTINSLLFSIADIISSSVVERKKIQLKIAQVAFILLALATAYILLV